MELPRVFVSAILASLCKCAADAGAAQALY
jgi:hypothetical protein